MTNPRKTITPQAGTPQAILSYANDLLLQPTRLTKGLWPRAAALLTRQALELSLTNFWQRFAYGTQDGNTQSQLISLPFYLNHEPELAKRIRWVWHRLSRACHAHPYEMAPTLGELRSWMSVVERLDGELARLTTGSEVPGAAGAKGKGTGRSDSRA
jgi:hypothetical protein